MRDYYEELWGRLPADHRPAGLELRRAFLVSEVDRGQRVLDLGCGDGTLTATLAGAGADVVGVDVAEAALRRARAAHPALDFRLAPIDGPLPFADADFDVVWASEVIEHVADTARWLSEARRVLRRDGRLLLTTPYHGRVKNVLIALARFEAHADPLGDHLRFYTRRSLSELLGELGFEEVSVRAAGGPPLLRDTLLASARRGSWVLT